MKPKHYLPQILRAFTHAYAILSYLYSNPYRLALDAGSYSESRNNAQY